MIKTLGEWLDVEAKLVSMTDLSKVVTLKQKKKAFISRVQLRTIRLTLFSYPEYVRMMDILERIDAMNYGILIVQEALDGNIPMDKDKDALLLEIEENKSSIQELENRLEHIKETFLDMDVIKILQEELK